MPSGRAERLTRIGWMAGEAALGGLWEKARRFAGGETGTVSAFLTEANAQRFARRLSRLRGAAMKLGQLLSMEGDDFLPSEVSEALASLRADADAMPAAQLEACLVDAYGASWRDRFSHFDPEPVAAASIGQVHGATAVDGRDLALKIQYPGVAESVDADVDNLAAVLRLTRLLPSQLDLSGVFAEAKEQLRAEADYFGEAERLRRYRHHLVGASDLVVPAVYEDLTAGHILAMERLRGFPLEEVCGAEYSQALRDRVGTALYRLLFRELFEFRFVQSDPNFANYLWLPEKQGIGLLDLGAARVVSAPISELYRELFFAGAERDADRLREVALRIGFFAPDERSDFVASLLELLRLGCEPFASREPYDFGRSTLPERIRELTLELAFGKGYVPPPPPETLFLHRKVGGTFLLCARLGARIPVRDLFAAHVAGRGD